MTVKVRTEITAVDKTKKAFASVDSNLKGLKTAAVAVSGVLAAIGVADFAVDALKAADEINKLSDRLGVSTEALSEYQFVADRTGVAFKNITDGFQKLGRRVSEATRGQGAAKDALRELGLEAEKLNRLEIDQQFEVVADALENVTGETDRLRIAQKLFDSENVKLLQTLKGGSAELQNLREQAREAGLTLSDEAADGASAAIDAWTNLSAGTKALGVTLVGVLGPVITDVVTWLSDNIPDAVSAASRAFDSLQVLVADLGAGLTSALADAERDLAAVAEFFGADTLAKAFRGAAEEYEKSSETFTAVSERIQREELDTSKARIEGIQAGITFQQIYNEELAKSAGVTAEVAKAEKSRRSQEEKAEEKRLEGIRQYIEALQVQNETLGLANEELIAYELGQLNASKATIETAQAIQEEIDAFKELERVEAENAEIFERSAELQKKASEDVARQAEKTNQQIRDSFVDAIAQADSFEDALDNLKKAFIDLAAQQLTGALAGGGAGGGGFGAIFQQLLGGLQGFQNGGRPPVGRPFIVGEGGQAEVMQVGAPASVSPVLKVAVDVSGGNAFGTDRSRQDFARQLGDEIGRSLRRNG